jgi:trans-aconitate methyltransferase
MTTALPAPTDLRRLLADWDRQQSGYLRRREERFTVALDVLEELLGEQLAAGGTVLDLGCGPGSFSARLLDRFPAASVVAVDMDPVLLAVGAGALGDGGGRLRWVDADLRHPGWVGRLPVDRVAAVVSSTALHWLSAGQLAGTYRRVAGLLAPGGVLLNADNMAYDPDRPTATRLAEAAERRRAEVAFGADGVPDWDTWWAAALAGPELAGAVAERQRRNAAERGPDDHEPGARLTGIRTHEALLLEAGFTEVGTVWQDHDDRVLLGLR